MFEMAQAQRSRSWLKGVLILLVLAAAAGGGWWWYGGALPGGEKKEEEAGKESKPVPVRIAAAETADFPVTLTGLGTVQAINSVTVRAQVSGQILHILFKEGQMVKQGDLLVEIDPRPLQAALDQAKARLAQDQANLQDAQANLARIQELAKKEFASRQQLDTQTALVSQGQAQIQSDQAAIADAQTRLDYASIRAPIPGRVGFRLADVGNVVSPSDAEGIVNIQQVQPIAVIFTAPEEALPAITKAVGQSVPPVTARSSDGTQELARGQLTRVNNEVDVASGSIRLKAVFENTDDRLWPGQSVSTELVVDTQKGATVVPVPAVQRGPDGLFVYAVGGDNKAKMQKVEVGPEDESRAVILDGLKPGDRIVTEGQYRVQDGVAVVEDGGEQQKPGGAKTAQADADQKTASE
jgi:membrane fusion protein, multidrug efflux system